MRGMALAALKTYECWELSSKRSPLPILIRTLKSPIRKHTKADEEPRHKDIVCFEVVEGGGEGNVQDCHGVYERHGDSNNSLKQCA